MSQKSILLIISIFLLSCESSIQEAEYIMLLKTWEPNEKAFQILIPENWIIEGGIYRIHPDSNGRNANALEAKLDFIIKNDIDGTASMRWYPDLYYFDNKFSEAGDTGLLTEGSIYEGMTVKSLLSAGEFIKQVILPYAHPRLTNISVSELKNLPEMVKALQNEDNLSFSMESGYDAALLTVIYTEEGIVYEEKFISAILNQGQPGAGIWENHCTFSVRTPKGQLNEFEAYFAAIRNSMRMNQEWLAGELEGQFERAGIYKNTKFDFNRFSEPVCQINQQINNIIQHEMFLTLKGQQEFINPFTNEIEIGTSQWNYRWSSNGDFVIYTDDPEFDPNREKKLNHCEFKPSIIKN